MEEAGYYQPIRSGAKKDGERKRNKKITCHSSFSPLSETACLESKTARSYSPARGESVMNLLALLALLDTNTNRAFVLLTLGLNNFN